MVDADGSSLRISPGPPGTVEVDRVVFHDVQRPRLAEKLDGNRLLLRADCPNFVVVRCESRYELRVPPSLQLAVAPQVVNARSDDADVLVVVPRGQAVYHVDASSTDGATTNDLRTDPASPLRITATSGSGDVVLRSSG